MKKVLKIIISILVILITIATVAFALIKTGVIDLTKIDKVNVYTHKDDNGFVYTTREWDWTPAKTTETIKYVDTTNIEKQTVSVNISGINYYSIDVPVGAYIYDYGKTIWAEDGSYLIRVISDCTLDNLSLMAGIDDGEALDQVTLTSKESRRKARTLCKLVDDDTAVVINVYSGSDTYSIIRDSLVSNNEMIHKDTIEYSDNFKELDAISYSGKFVAQVIYSQIDLDWLRYLFEDGELSIYAKFDSLAMVRSDVLAQLIVYAGAPIDEMYEDENVVYAKAGDWYVGMVRHNTNTTIVFIGSGEEAKCNIVSLIDSIM